MATKKNTKKKSSTAKKSNARKPTRPARKQTAKKKIAPAKTVSRKTAAPKNITRKKAPAKAKKAAPQRPPVRKKAPAKAKPVKARGAKAPKKITKAFNRPRRDKDIPLDSLDLSPDVSGLESGDLEGLSNDESADSESVDELLEEGNAFEAGVVFGVEESRGREGQEVRTREVPEDDVPQEYLDPD
jgi:hypothetical protein